MSNRMRFPAHAPGRVHPVDVAALRHLGLALRELTADSRAVKPGMAFAAYPGTLADGRQFIPQAIARGAESVLWEHDGFAWNDQWSVPNQGIAGLRSQVSGIAGQIHGDPSHHLWVVGITGTNGKTSCSHWLAQLMQHAGRPCAVVGTLGNGLPPGLEPSANTTPDAIELQAALARYRAQGAWGCAMEVSSHGLEQERVSGIAFRGALFTNLSRDHLDYHGTLEAYGAAKALLFESAGLEFAVVNLDDAFGAQLSRHLAGRVPRVIGYSQQGADRFPGLEQVWAGNIVMQGGRLQFDFTGDCGTLQVQAPLMGRFNVSNLLAVIATGLSGGLTLEQVRSGLAGLRAPSGRLERLGGGDRPTVVIDYAHTPDALEKALATVREAVAPGRTLTCVFGCGGNRDPGKRPMMGAIAGSLADRVILTNDNPRFESPGAILDQIAAGMTGTPERIPDRAQAIREAIREARPGDVVLIAGKGHESMQEVAGESHAFSDRAEALGCLKEQRT